MERKILWLISFAVIFVIWFKLDSKHTDETQDAQQLLRHYYLQEAELAIQQVQMWWATDLT